LFINNIDIKKVKIIFKINKFLYYIFIYLTYVLKNIEYVRLFSKFIQKEVKTMEMLIDMLCGAGCGGLCSTLSYTLANMIPAVIDIILCR